MNHKVDAHSNPESVKCSFCEKEFSLIINLQIHTQESHTETECRLCHNMFDNKSLQEYIIANHVETSNHPESHDLQMKAIKELKTLLLNFQSANENNFHALKADFTIVQRDIAIMKNKETPKEDNSFIVENEVNKVQTSVDCVVTDPNDNAEVPQKSLGAIPKYSCKQCEFIGGTYWDLKHHVTAMHNRKTNNEIQSHSLDPMDRANFAFKCPDCDSKFRTFSNLMHHLKFIHNVINFPCYKCDLTFATKQNFS